MHGRADKGGKVGWKGKCEKKMGGLKGKEEGKGKVGMEGLRREGGLAGKENTKKCVEGLQGKRRRQGRYG